MVRTRSEKKDDLDYVIQQVLGQGPDSPVYKAVIKSGISSVFELVTFPLTSLGDLTYDHVDPTSQTTSEKKLQVFHIGLISSFVCFVQYRSDQGSPIDHDA